MYNSITDIEKSGDKFYGQYRGEVISVDDPDQDGRMQIRVYPMFEGVADADLPWAICVDVLGGGTPGVGSSFYPEKGSHVWVFFEAGDHRFPVWWAGAPGKSGGPTEAKTGYPHNKVIKTKGGHLVEIDDSDGNLRFHVKHPSGTDHLVDNEGTVTDLLIKDHTVTIGGNSNITITGQHNITATGNITITSSGVVTIVGSSVAIN